MRDIADGLMFLYIGMGLTAVIVAGAVGAGLYLMYRGFR